MRMIFFGTIFKGKSLLWIVLVMWMAHVALAGPALPYNTEWNDEMEKAEEFVDKGDYKNALETMTKAQAVYEKENDEEGVLLCMERMAVLLKDTAEYDKALKLLQKAYSIGMRLHGDAAELDADLGDIYLFSGDSEKAAEYYQKAMTTLKDYVYPTSYKSSPSRKELSESIRKCKGVIHANNELGLKFYFEGNYDSAIACLQKADDTCNRILQVKKKFGMFFHADNGLYDGIGFTKTTLGAVYGRKGNLEKAAAFFDEGEEAFKTGKRHFGLLVNHALRYEWESLLPDMKWDKDKLEEVSRFLKQAEGFGAIDLVWRTNYGVGSALAKQKRYAEAKTYLKQAIDGIESTRSRFQDDSMKQRFTSSVQDVYSAIINLLYETKEDEESFNYFERAKSRSFLEMLAGRPLRIKKSVDATLQKREKEVQAQIDEILSQMKFGMAENKQNITQRYQQLLQEQNEILGAIKRQSLDYASTLTVTTLPAKKISERLGNKTALIAYFVDTERTLIFVLNQGHVSITETKIGRRKLAGQVAEYREAITSAQQTTTLNVGKDLVELLVEPIKAKLTGANQLLVIPSEALHYLPFASLPLSPERYLIQDYAVAVLPNAASLFFIEQNVTRNMRKSLAFGNPERKTAETPLKFAEREVKELSTLFAEPTALTGPNAKESTLKNTNLTEIGVIHLAAHGRYRAEKPMDSAILLAGDTKDDGDLHAWEVFSLTMNPKVVVLSACQSGLGRVSGGNEVQGLNRAFLYAGAGSVLASLWNVSDESTYKLMKHFYQQLPGSNPAKALQEAQLRLIAEHLQPYFWASFYLTGSVTE